MHYSIPTVCVMFEKKTVPLNENQLAPKTLGEKNPSFVFLLAYVPVCVRVRACPCGTTNSDTDKKGVCLFYILYMQTCICICGRLCQYLPVWL